MAVLNWDHTMINVQDVDRAAQFFGERGIVFARGGRHEKWGTENALGYFGLNYIELISVYDEARAKSFPRAGASAVYDAVQDYEQKVQRTNTIAIRTSDIEATHARLKEAGINAGDIEVGKRLDEQGRLITWSIFFIDGTIDGLPYPFFIQWQGSDETREQKLKDQGLIMSHPAGDLLVRQAVFHVPDPYKTAGVWGQLLENNPEKTDSGYKVHVEDRQLIFEQGLENHIIQLNFDGAGDQLKQQTLVFDQIKFAFK
ncbi:VOC family protein [Sporolactobacillus shoreicorticis]|uniref:VOC family protein n=1 Tax=Sporolactobacillus shoreicorticis TaxID=1923877 RepID=A0ABW5S147_9BACL|nr:VOC family protein [Sporolactobacillus shoreicorticis]MCO7125339.1 VOC family protein [Sporolactobacillus shoreicorticis]